MGDQQAEKFCLVHLCTVDSSRCTMSPGLSRMGSTMSILDCSAIGSSMSVRSFVRIGSSFSIHSDYAYPAVIYAPLRVEDYVQTASSFSVRSYVRLGSTLSLYGMARLVMPCIHVLVGAGFRARRILHEHQFQISHKSVTDQFQISHRPVSYCYRPVTDQLHITHRSDTDQIRAPPCRGLRPNRVLLFGTMSCGRRDKSHMYHHNASDT